MKVKPIGIRKDKSWILPIFIIITVSTIVAAVIFWLFYGNEYRYEYLLNNGVEVEATVVDYYYDYHSGENDYSTSGWFYHWNVIITAEHIEELTDLSQRKI